MSTPQNEDQHSITLAIQNADAARMRTSQAILALLAELAGESESPNVQRLYQRASAMANSHANAPVFKL